MVCKLLQLTIAVVIISIIFYTDSKLRKITNTYCWSPTVAKFEENMYAKARNDGRYSLVIQHHTPYSKVGSCTVFTIV